jgi:hypothetical protein
MSSLRIGFHVANACSADLTLLLQLSKGLGQDFQGSNNARILSREWELPRILNAIGHCLHNVVIERPAKRCPEIDAVPIGGGLAYQDLKERAIGGRYSSA